MKKLMSNPKVLLALVIALLAMNLALLWYTFGGGNNRGRSGRNGFSLERYMQKEVGFDTTQVAAFKDLLGKNRDSMKIYGERIKHAKTDLYKLMRQENVTDLMVDSAVSILAQEQKAMDLMMYHHFEQVRKICNATQLAKFDSMVTRMSNRTRWFRRSSNNQDSVK